MDTVTPTTYYVRLHTGDYLGKYNAIDPLGPVARPFRYPFTAAEASLLAQVHGGFIEPR